MQRKQVFLVTPLLGLSDVFSTPLLSRQKSACITHLLRQLCESIAVGLLRTHMCLSWYLLWPPLLTFRLYPDCILQRPVVGRAGPQKTPSTAVRAQVLTHTSANSHRLYRVTSRALSHDTQNRNSKNQRVLLAGEWRT